MRTTDLISEIDAFLDETKMGHAYFGVKSCGNSKLVKRLRAGVTPERGSPVMVRPETERLIRDFMAVERAKRKAA